ncbi:Ig-like domain-containing protein [Marinobacterium lutimaris]|uniref:M6 family metalloprotease domain-containing protein n=1 Tax=Marinobacterium lutimaris TaxID=568106 RepID=A0A1H5WYT3_9GAMM|nr:Ig-like domain-containing protein [Marinobacterium lutimaris]SEG04631.1 M6 family metalloprotease domain-containing protein [Marinobacterium lutimaris]
MRLTRPALTRTLLSVSLATALGGFTLPSIAASTHTHGQQQSESNRSRQAMEHTQALMTLQKRWANAKGADKSRALSQMLDKAAARRELLEQIVTTDPATVLRVAIPSEIQSGMPAEVRAKLEQRLELSGQLDVFYEDHEDGSHRLRHVLNTDFGEKFEMHFAGTAPEVSKGTAATVYGVLFANDSDDDNSQGDLVLSSDNLMLAAGSTSNANLGGTAQAGWTFGEQPTLVINVNFADNATQPWTRAQAQNTVFESVNDFIRENSSDQTWLSGDVTPWLNLPINGASCDTTAIVTAADNAAAAAGYDLSRYKRLIYAMPYSSSCGFSGVGSVGGWPSTTVINGSMSLYTVAHELGHNLGLYHSHALECGSAVTGSGCSTDEYGDSTDIMGRVTSHYTTFQKERLGWLDDSSIQTVTQSGVYSLEPYAGSQGSAPKALKVQNGIDAATGLPLYYYLEYRFATGFDSGLSSVGNIQDGVVVHTGVESRGNTSYLLDMTPGSGSSSYSDPRDAALVTGNSFNSGDLTLATEWVDGQTAGINIQLDGTVATCSRANPGLSLTPGESEWLPAGSTVTYTLTLTNRDSSVCGANSFSLGKSAPTGWSSTLGNTTLTLAPGESASTTLTVTSSTSATDGFYAVNTSATSGSFTASDEVTYVVDNPVIATNSAPVANNDSASTDYETAVSINVLANDTDADGDTLSISSVSGGNGSAVVNADGTLTFTPSTGFSGTTSISYTITDGKASDSATVSINVASAPVAANLAPIAKDDSAITDAGSAVTINVLANDSDPDGDALNLVTVSEGGKGSVRINADGTLTFTPAKNFKNFDSFSYTISDGSLTATATVTVTLATDTSSGDSTTDTTSPTGGKGNGRNK